MSFTTKPATEANACAVCFEDYQVGESIISHDGDGEKHPVHRACLDQWARQRIVLEQQPNCPTCVVNVTSVDGMNVAQYRQSLQLDANNAERAMIDNIQWAIRRGDVDELRRVFDTGFTLNLDETTVGLVLLTMRQHRLDLFQVLIAHTNPPLDVIRYNCIYWAVQANDEEIIDFLLEGHEGLFPRGQTRFDNGPGNDAILLAIQQRSWSIALKLLPYGQLDFNDRLDAVENLIMAARANPQRDYSAITRALVRYPDGTHIMPGPADLQFYNIYFIYRRYVDYAHKLDDDEIMRELLETQHVAENERNWSAIKRSLALLKPIVAARLITNEVCTIASETISDFVDSLE